jgi:hypothetical protein
MKTKIIIAVSILLLILLISHYKKTHIPPPEVKIDALQAHIALIDSMSVPELIEYLAPENAAELKKVAYCESRYNPQAVGDHGLAKGILQFHQGTFNTYSNQIGEQLQYESTYDQIKVANYMWNKGQAHQWTCARLTKII